MGQQGEFCLFMPEGRKARHWEPRCVGDATSCRDLYVLRRRFKKVSCKREWEHVDHGLTRTCVERQIQANLCGRPMKLRPNDDQTPGRVERVVHTTMAVPWGGLPK